MPEFIRVEQASGVGRVTLARAERHNCFNEVMMGEITAAFRDLGGDRKVRVVVLASEGDSFSAGADVNWMRRMVDYSFDENVSDAMVLARMLRTIHDCPKPVIARVQGAALGGGVGLTAACDMAVAAERAFFALTEVKLGIIPAVISPFVLEKIGMGAMRRYALTAERFDAEEAKRIGLISEVERTDAEMDAWIADRVKALVGNSPEALTACKAVLREVSEYDWDKAATITAKRIAERRVSPDGQEGLRAFLEKRPPAWTKG